MNQETMTTRERIAIRTLRVELKSQEVEERLRGIEGIEQFRLVDGIADVSFYPQLISLRTIKAEMGIAGIKLAEPGKARGFFGRFVDRLAESNKKNFGSSKLDCCNLNNKKAGSSPSGKQPHGLDK